MTDISQLIFQMQQPNFYPHAVAENIQIVQTHASLVFLTGDYTYKIKKSVNYGFLDYSTLDKREHFIAEELRLNQKIAPDLYLEVVTIRSCDRALDSPKGRRAASALAYRSAYRFNGGNPRTDKPHNDNALFRQLTMGGLGDVVEYALKMRQFPQSNLFSNLLEAGKLDEERFAELGKIVAQFHLSAETSDRISSFGEVNKIQAAFTENYQQSQKYIGTVQTQEQFAATKAYTDAFFDRRPDLLVNRIKQNKIKECHGDLHLKNICLWQDKIQLFDRIEFNESFRFVDTMHDVAFTVMDLAARGYPEFANIFLNSYLENSGDWEGLLVLPFYLSRQAYVRAKVNSFLLDDPQIGEIEKQEAKETASNYYRQAYRYTKRKSGGLIIMSGLSGSGKSSVAKTIARSKGAIQIRSDAARKQLAGIPLSESGTDSIYTPKMTQKTYARLLELGTMLAKAGYTVILDAKYDRLSLRQPVITQAEGSNISLKIVHCTAPMSVLRDRLNQRQNDISDANADLIASQKANAEDFTTAEQAYVTTVDTSQSNWQEKLNNI